jgi:calcineurin-like phosphoesterase family protein
MSKKFVTSDPHFWHKNVIQHCHRPFANVEEMNSILIRNWNEVVSSEDTVYLLGDVCWWKIGDEKYYEILDSLNFKRLEIVFGNHDKIARRNVYPDSGCGFYPKGGTLEKIKGKSFYDRFPSMENKDIGTQDVLFLDERKEPLYSAEGCKFHLSHYPISRWCKGQHGNFHLFGHVHGTYTNPGRSIDVGVDCHDFYPITIDRAMQLCEINNEKNPHIYEDLKMGLSI